MNIIPVTYWFPIICPQQQFTDKTGSPNAYQDTNPSLYVDSSGNARILVRQVNYRKFKDRSFFVGENQSRSIYHTINAIYANSKFTIQNSSPLQHETTLQKYSTYWYGPEDIRFVTSNTILATYPELGPGGNPRVVSGSISGSGSINFTELLGGGPVEKNWMPFLHCGSPYIVYSVSPLIIRPLRSTESISLHTLSDLEGYHGSTNGICYKQGYLFLIHKYTQKTEHRWLYINLHTRHVAYSEPFAFFPHSYIEFPCSLVELPDKKIAISLGVNDSMAYIAVIEPEVIELCELLTTR
jgi:hypothetical protein